MNRRASTKRAALYLRGTEGRDSWRAQGDAGELVQLRGWTLVDTFGDEERVRGRRRGLHALINAVRARQLDVVVVSSLDRIVGSLHELVVLVELLRSYDCDFVSTREPKITTLAPQGALLRELLGTFAGFARDVRVGRRRLALERNRTRAGRRSTVDVSRARALQAAGKTYAAIAVALGVSKAAVGRALVSKLPGT